jgi:hypothetical protein
MTRPRAVDWVDWHIPSHGKSGKMVGYLQGGVKMTISLVESSLGTFEVKELTFNAEEAQVLLNTKYFQGVGLGRILTEAREELNSKISAIEEVYLEPQVDKILRKWQSNGSAPLPRYWYAAIAFKYHHLVRDGNKNPIEELSAFMGAERSATSKRVAEARRMGFLTAGKKGSPGGFFTSLGEKTLEGREE